MSCCSAPNTFQRSSCTSTSTANVTTSARRNRVRTSAREVRKSSPRTTLGRQDGAAAHSQKGGCPSGGDAKASLAKTLAGRNRITGGRDILTESLPLERFWLMRHSAPFSCPEQKRTRGSVASGYLSRGTAPSCWSISSHRIVRDAAGSAIEAYCHSAGTRPDPASRHAECPKSGLPGETGHSGPPCPRNDATLNVRWLQKRTLPAHVSFGCRWASPAQL